MEAINLGREKLFDLVWAKTVSGIADELNLKAEDIPRFCRDSEILLSEQVHCSKLNFGKAKEQIPLPPSPERNRIAGNRNY